MSDQEQTPTVVTGFTTPSRRFTAGQPVTPPDIDGPVPFERWVALGHIALPKPPPEKAGKAGKTAPTEPDAAV